MIKKEELRLRIFTLLVKSKQTMTMSEIARRLRIPQQNVSYHLPLLERSGLIIKEGNSYFPQPIFIDEDLHEFCAEKLAEIIEQFSSKDHEIFVGDDVDEEEREEIILNCLQAMVLLIISPEDKP